MQLLKTATKAHGVITHIHNSQLIIDFYLCDYYIQIVYANSQTHPVLGKQDVALRIYYFRAILLDPEISIYHYFW